MIKNMSAERVERGGGREGLRIGKPEKSKTQLANFLGGGGGGEDGGGGEEEAESERQERVPPTVPGKKTAESQQHSHSKQTSNIIKHAGARHFDLAASTGSRHL